MQLFSPAKVNWNLKILGKREDGFHSLSSHFQTISLGDTLFFEFSDADKLTIHSDHLDVSKIPCNASNLIWKAIDVYRVKTGVFQPVYIHLNKNIPFQAGLGGGSSNAATALWAYNQLLGNLLTIEELKNLGALVGSDVPFFFSTGCAKVTGRGEHVQDIAFSAENFDLYKPDWGHETKDVFMNFQPQDCGFYINDLTLAATRLNPQFQQLTKLLDQSQISWAMTGSGSAFWVKNEKQPLDLPYTSFLGLKSIIRQPSKWYHPSNIL